MATKAINGLLQLLRANDAITDGDLLKQYVVQRDPAALEQLVHRHGSMVLGVCRRILGHEADAEDAFQVTFLVLLRKAASIRSQRTVGNWLYGVAHNTALKAKAMNHKRRVKEREAGTMPKQQTDVANWQEIQIVLDAELSVLPSTYRSAIVLCDLEGKTLKEAADQLGWPQGTVATRLRRGRALLAKRLTQRGVALSAGGLTAAIAQAATPVTVPASLCQATIESAAATLSGAAQASVISTNVAILTKGVLTSMYLNKLKVALGCCIALCAAASVGPSAYYVVAGEEAMATLTQAPEPESHPAQEPTRATALQGAVPQAPRDREIHGSGKVVTKEYPFTDFTNLDIGRAIHVELTQADAFRVAITTDDNMIPEIKVYKDGSKLQIDLDPTIKSFWLASLKATITMPRLEGISLGQRARLSCKGFKSLKQLQAKLTGGSTLDGEVEAEKLDLIADSQSNIFLKGQAKEAKITANQACRVSLADLVLGVADVTLKSDALAVVHVKHRLEYDLSDSSRLEYIGSPPINKGKIAGGALVGRAGPNAAADLAKMHTNGHHSASSHHHQHAAKAAEVSVGQKAPDFTVRDLDGKLVKLSDLQKDTKKSPHGVVVLSFWCSTCPSCRRVEQHLDKLARDFQGQAFIAALDANAGETGERVQAAAKKYGITLPILLNADGWIADLFGTAVTTTMVVIDGDGRLRYCGRFHEGNHAYAEEALRAVLAGKEVTVKTTPHDGCSIIR